MKDFPSLVALVKLRLFDLITICLLLLLAAVVLRTLGLNLPIHNIGHVELAYLAGSLYLLRK